MTYIAPREEIDRIRAIVGRHDLPPFVKGYDVEFGEFDGTPAFWIDLIVAPNTERSFDALMSRQDELGRFIDTIQPELFAQIDDRYPFFKFSHAAPDRKSVD